MKTKLCYSRDYREKWDTYSSVMKISGESSWDYYWNMTGRKGGSFHANRSPHTNAWFLLGNRNPLCRWNALHMFQIKWQWFADCSSCFARVKRLLQARRWGSSVFAIITFERFIFITMIWYFIAFSSNTYCSSCNLILSFNLTAWKESRIGGVAQITIAHRSVDSLIVLCAHKPLHNYWKNTEITLLITFELKTH